MHKSNIVRAAGLSILAASTLAALPALGQNVEVTLLEAPAGFNGITPRRVSATGDAVVGTLTRNQAVNPGYAKQGFLWTRAGGMRVLPVAPGWDGAEAVAVSADGRKVLGNYFALGTDSKKAFVWTAGTGAVTLGPFPFERSLVAADMSDDGSVLLLDLHRWQSLIYPGSPYGLRTVVRIADGLAVDMNPGIYCNLSSAGDLSADGSAFGGVIFDYYLNPYSSFVQWTTAGGLRDAGANPVSYQSGSNFVPAWDMFRVLTANNGTSLALGRVNKDNQIGGFVIDTPSTLYRTNGLPITFQNPPPLSGSPSYTCGTFSAMDATGSVVVGRSRQVYFNSGIGQWYVNWVLRPLFWTSQFGSLDWATYIQSLDPNVNLGTTVSLTDLSSDGLSFLGTSLISIEANATPIQRAWVTRIGAYLTTNAADIVNGSGELPRDGIVDGSDFVAFINAFAAEDPLADITGGTYGGPDGAIDGSDFIAFINGFATGV